MNESTPLPARRRLAAGLLGLIAGGALGPPGAAAQTPIRQPDPPTPREFMRRAFAQRDLAVARGDQGFGAVVVKDDRIVAAAPSRVVTAGDPTAHAEMEAIREAARALGTRDLGGCVLYASSRPCPMCEAAAMWAGVSRVVYGPDLTDGGAPRAGWC